MVTRTLETLEERLTALEQEMTRVKERLGSQNTRPTNPWLEDVYGAFKDDPLFEDAVRYGREWRESQTRRQRTGSNAASPGHCVQSAEKASPTLQ